MTSRLGVLLAAVLVVLAGCAGGVGTAPPTDTTVPGAASAPGPGEGTVRLYVSDERNAIDDFARVNITITRVGFMLVDGSAGDGANVTATGMSGDDPTATPAGTATPTPDADPTATPAGNATAAPDGNATAAGANGEQGPPDDVDGPPENDGQRGDDGGDEGGPDDGEDEGDDSDDEPDAENDGEGDDGEDNGRWIVHDVPDTTVDVTRLKGANASLLGAFDVPDGEYAKVFLYVGEVEGVLASGEEVRVKLPSERLHVTERFTVGNGQPVDFVFDVTVFEAGKSGKYILKPVVSESGPDEPVQRVDDASSRGSPDLAARFVGPVAPGDAATLKVTRGNAAVADATVRYDGSVVGRTGGDGTLLFQVPEGAGSVEVTVESGGDEVTVEREFGEE